MFGFLENMESSKGVKSYPHPHFAEESTEFCSYLLTLMNLTYTFIQLSNLFKNLM